MVSKLKVAKLFNIELSIALPKLGNKAVQGLQQEDHLQDQGGQRGLLSAGGFLPIKWREIRWQADFEHPPPQKTNRFLNTFLSIYQACGKQDSKKKSLWLTWYYRSSWSNSFCLLCKVLCMADSWRKESVGVHLRRRITPLVIHPISSWVSLSINFKLPRHCLSQVKWQDFTCWEHTRLSLPSVIPGISKIMVNVSMKFGMGVCKIFYSGLSHLGIFIFNDSVTHKYP